MVLSFGKSIGIDENGLNKHHRYNGWWYVISSWWAELIYGERGHSAFWLCWGRISYCWAEGLHRCGLRFQALAISWTSDDVAWRMTALLISIFSQFLCRRRRACLWLWVSQTKNFRTSSSGVIVMTGDLNRGISYLDHVDHGRNDLLVIHAAQAGPSWLLCENSCFIPSDKDWNHWAILLL